MRLLREHVTERSRPLAEAVPDLRHPAAYVALVAGGAAIGVAGGDGLNAIGLIAATVGSWLLAATFRPSPDAGLIVRIRDLTRERDGWQRNAERLAAAIEDAGSAVGARPASPREASEPDGDDEELLRGYVRGGGRPGRIGVLPADHDAEGLDPSGDDGP